MKKRLVPIVMTAVLALSACVVARHRQEPARLPAAALQTDRDAIALIKEQEALRLKAYFYGGQWLIGYGHAEGVKKGMTITRAEAERFLARDIAQCEGAVSRTVTVPVTANEFSAMVALCYNIGAPKFAASSVAERLNAGDRKGAADAFLMWDKGTVEGEKTELAHLKARRETERALFLSGAPAEQGAQASR